ncbi:MAG: class I SAM-dependent methyltransferase [Bacteroidetes bacterium]|nr:MAG: class I SAM-dependent methyltransferase [Bacteroidota bacterium]
MQPLDEREMAAQLRKPHGENAVLVSEFMQKANENLYKEFSKIFSPAPGSSILEIGPANGAFIGTVLSCGQNLRYTSIDLSEEMVDASKKLNETLLRSGKIEITQGNCRKMNFESSAFDYIIGINTVYFWDPIELYLEEIKRVLKPSANLILAYRTKSGMMELPFSRYGFSLYEAEDLELILRKSGFGSVYSNSFPEEISGPDGRKLRLDAVFTLASSL